MTTQTPSTLSKSISWIRFPLVLMVLFVHVHPMENPAYVGMRQLAGAGSAQIVYTILATLGNIASNLAVPMFFFMAGLLFFNRCDGWSWGFYTGKLKSRFRTLFIPYLLFNALCLINPVVLPLLGYPAIPAAWANPDALPVVGFLWNSTTFCVGWKTWLGFDIQLWYPEDVALWFVCDLMVMVLLSPLLYWLIRKGKAWTLAVFGGLFLVGIFTTLPGLSTNALFFFSAGAYFSIHRIDFTAWTHRYGRPLLTVALIALALATASDGRGFAFHFQQLYFITGVGGLFYVVVRLVERNKLRPRPLLDKSSFFVYAVHLVPFMQFSLLGIATNFCAEVFNWQTTVLGASAYYLVSPLVAAALCIGLYVLLKKACPPVHRLLTGGR